MEANPPSPVNNYLKLLALMHCRAKMMGNRMDAYPPMLMKIIFEQAELIFNIEGPASEWNARHV